MSLLAFAYDFGGDALGFAFVAGAVLSFFLWRVLRHADLDADDDFGLRPPEHDRRS